MSILAVQRQGAVVGIKAQALIVTVDGRLLTTKPLHEVDELQLYGDVGLTPAARAVVLRRGIDTVFLTPAGGYQGHLVARESRHAERRIAQYRKLSDPKAALALARGFVAAKLRNQRSLLLRIRRERAVTIDPASLASLRCLLPRVEEAQNLDVLRGLEGHAAAMYFAGFAAALTNSAFVFTGRNRRPPKDPVNACLSFGYTLLLMRVESALRRAGLDTYLGALHDPGRGKPALALDLMEPLRPLVVDRLVLRLINRRQLSPTDFIEPTASTQRISAPDEDLDPEVDLGALAVHLGPLGRPIFLREFAAMWRSRHDHPLLDGRHRLEDIVTWQAYQLGRIFTGDAEGVLPPVVLR